MMKIIYTYNFILDNNKWFNLDILESGLNFRKINIHESLSLIFTRA